MPGATIAFASTVPGRVLPIDAAENGGMICQKGASLCAQDSVNLDVTFTKKFTSGLFGGEGFILESISGSGMVSRKSTAMLSRNSLHRAK